MTSAQYHGHFPVTYPDHIDAATGRTLTVEPGGIYDVRVAPGRNPGLSPVPGDGRWSASRGRPRTARGPAREDPPAAPAPAPAGTADDSETETIPAAPEGAPAPPESEE